MEADQRFEKLINPRRLSVTDLDDELMSANDKHQPSAAVLGVRIDCRATLPCLVCCYLQERPWFGGWPLSRRASSAQRFIPEQLIASLVALLGQS